MDPLPGDGIEYELLTEAARRTSVPGLVCEIGTRLGGGIQAMIDGLSQPRAIISVDPYGDIPYPYSDAHGLRYNMGYDQSMMVEAFRTIPAACAAKGHLWIPVVLEDYEFFRRYADGFPIYDCQKKFATEYAMVHIDGPHDTNSLVQAIEFFVPRLAVGGCLAFDNINYFDWGKIENYIHYNRVYGEAFLRVLFAREAIGETKAVYRRLPGDYDSGSLGALESPPGSGE